MISSDYIALGAAVIASLSAVFSFLTWQAALAEVKASLFAERMAVFKDVKSFMVPWFRQGRPDLNELHILVDAWERSQFLFEPSVTAFLRKLWKDAVRAEYHARIQSGELTGDRNRAVDILHKINSQYLFGDAEQPDIFLDAFKMMKIAQ